jgi:hypothetical protein
MQLKNDKAKQIIITESRKKMSIFFCLVKMTLPLYKARDYISMGEDNNLGHSCMWYAYRFSLH